MTDIRAEAERLLAEIVRLTAERDAAMSKLRERVECEHGNAVYWPKGSERYGHRGEWAECPHEDCRMVQGR